MKAVTAQTDLEEVWSGDSVSEEEETSLAGDFIKTLLKWAFCWPVLLIIRRFKKEERA